MTPEEKLAERQARWEKMQRDGIWRFALREGVLKWGFGTAILWLVLMSVLTKGDFNYVIMIPYALVAFPIAGVFFGIFMWYVLHGLNRLSSKLAQRKLK